MAKKKKSKTIPAKTRKTDRITFENQNRSPGTQAIYNKIADIDSWAKRTAKGPTKVKITKQAAALRKSTDELIAKNTPKQTKATEAARAKKFEALKKKKKTKKGK